MEMRKIKGERKRKLRMIQRYKREVEVRGRRNDQSHSTFLTN
jgi:hypothetical protein